MNQAENVIFRVAQRPATSTSHPDSTEYASRRSPLRAERGGAAWKCAETAPCAIYRRGEETWQAHSERSLREMMLLAAAAEGASLAYCDVENG